MQFFVKLHLIEVLALLIQLGKGHPSKTDEFSEKFLGGGGGIFNPKIYIAKFGPLNRAFLA